MPGSTIRTRLAQIEVKPGRPAENAARKAMVQIFEMLGDHPAVPRYRSRMMNLLY